MTTWLYFAATSRASEQDTLDLARSGYIWRSVYNSVGQAIANVRNVMPGDQLILLYEGVAVGVFEVLNPGPQKLTGFSAAAQFPAELTPYLTKINYIPDAKLQAFTGFLVDAGGDEQLAELVGHRFQKISRNALQKLDDSASQSTGTKEVRNISDRAISEFGKSASFLDLPSSLIVPKQGDLFLGIDVGYARLRESLGYCVLQMGNEGIQPLMKCGQINGYGLSTIDNFEQKLLPALLDSLSGDQFVSIALDGPMVPNELNCTEYYRPQERFFLQNSVFPKRIRAQAYKSGIGNKLTQATGRLRKVCEKFGYRYEAHQGIVPNHKGLILEAFPKPFLAMLFDPEHIDANLNRFGVERSAADWTMATWLFDKMEEGVAGTVAPFLEKLRLSGLPISVNVQGMQSILNDKDRTSAYISALSSVLSFSGAASALGCDRYGSFILPASGLWHEGWKPRFSRAKALPEIAFRDNI